MSDERAAGDERDEPMSGRQGTRGVDRLRGAWRAVTAGDVDLSVRVGSLELPNPVMTASGTAGHADELQAYFPMGRLGAVVVKSLSVDPWPGNPAPRVHQTAAGMLNSVGLQGPGIEAWISEDLPRLVGTGARIVVSIWGQRVEDFAKAAAALSGVDGLTAVEVNVSCPNIEDRRRMFAHSPTATAEVVAAVGEGCPDLPRWAKLSPTVADLAEVAGAALSAGAEAVTLINTVLAMAIDVESRRPVLGSGPLGGGLSGPAVHPVAVRAVFDVRAAHPDATIIGVGGVMTGVDAIELVLAGADAVQVGTAIFRDPRAPIKILDQMEAWCSRRGVRRLHDLCGAAHG
jgi:dihydroorotate dehydrogenase (NAD+) catalytic subunit